MIDEAIRTAIAHNVIAAGEVRVNYGWVEIDENAVLNKIKKL